MGKEDAVKQLKRRVRNLERERDEALEAIRQTHLAVDAVLREVVKKFGEKDENGDIVLFMPVPNILEKGKVYGEKCEDLHKLTLKGEEYEEQVGEPC